jgi:tetratricopeptide (TPR) repeat protein
MKVMGLVFAVGIALGQQALWLQHMKEADAFEQAGRYKDAKAAYQLALEDEETPSDSGFRQATTCNNLALINRYLGDYSQARLQYQRALGLFEKTRGPGSPEYASALHNLSVLYYLEGQLDEAARQFRRALKIREVALGESHPATAQTLNSLSAVYTIQGRYAEAERLCRSALAIEEKALGPEHPHILVTLDSLATICRKRGQFETALDLSRRADQIAQKAYGDQLPLTCLRASKAILYGKLGRYPEAQELLQRILDVQRQALGEDSPNVATTMANLAAVCFRRNQLEQSGALYRRALVIFERFCGDEENVAAVLLNYACVLRHTGNKSEAKKLEARARAMRARSQNYWRRFAVDVNDLLSPR